MKLVRGILAGGLATFALVEYFFWNMELAGVGKTIFFLLLLGSYYIAVGIPVGTTRNKIEHFTLLFAVLALSVSYTLYDNKGLEVLNFLVNIFLMGLLFLQGVLGDTVQWDSGIFQLERIAGYFVRPFVCIHLPWMELATVGKTGDHENRRKSLSTVLYVFLALVVGIPLLLILATLLFNADPVFAGVFKPFFEALSQFRLDTIIGKSLIFIFLAPFVLSSIWSYRNKVFLFKNNAKTDNNNKVLPAAFAITILVMVNTLYLLYAIVQFRYLFSAGSGILPGNITYAEYARSGFFELAFIAFINIILMIFSVRFTARKGAPGIVIRVMSVLLMALSVVQLVSAFLRMNLYIQVYGLSMLRYFVTAFMILAAFYFLFVLLREFFSRFPLFKSFVFAGALALVALNYSVPDHQIALYNTRMYLAGSINDYDVIYMENDLSASGHLVMLEYEDEILEREPSFEAYFNGLKNPSIKDFGNEDPDQRDPDPIQDYKTFVLCDAQFNEKILAEQAKDAGK
jgi:hypothetical protein